MLLVRLARLADWVYFQMIRKTQRVIIILETPMRTGYQSLVEAIVISQIA